MTLVILSATVAMLSFLGIPVIAGRFGADVAARFLEKGGAYTEASLAGFTAAAASHLVHVLGLSVQVTWALVALSGLYLAADLVEDTLLAVLLTVPARLSPGAVATARAATGVKVVTATVALLLVLGLAMTALVRGAE